MTYTVSSGTLNLTQLNSTHGRMGQTDRQTELRQQYHALHYMQLHGKKSFRHCRLSILTGHISRQLRKLLLGSSLETNPRLHCTG